ncbi:MAG TPA: hypothetical protein VGX68_18630 [Thermoanaerobaculia bacterium]|nr:hypothetical protein [Thermoanaerobaculia bacterium]
MAARLDTPVLGVQDTYTGPNRWQVSMSWRYQRSDRHFVGPEEQAERQEEGSEVINHINIADLGIRYNATPQWSVSLGIPYFRAARSGPIRDSNRVVVARSRVESESVGDIVLKAQRLMWKPLTHPNGNVGFGLGVKFPTGKYDVEDRRLRLVNGQYVTDTTTVDQSIQPGDGGYGVVLDLQGFQRVPNSGFALYGSASYLINPRNTNGVPTFRNNVGEEIMSVADQYVARVGSSYTNKNMKGFGVSLGGRLEGVPVEDLIGSSDGFRRPGYAISAEPGVSWSHGPHALSLNVPVALYRNRTRSVADRRIPGRHGDAAFADYIVMFGYWRKY